MKNLATGWMRMFLQMRSPTGFLQSFFTVKPGNIYNGKTVEIDIQRMGEDVAVALKSGTESNFNDADIVTTKEFTPPSYGEAFPADVEELLERSAGVDPYSDAGRGYAAKLISKVMTYFKLANDKIIRGVELQASQILQTGKLALTGDDGETRFELDFKPKAAHFPTAGTVWTSASSTKIADLQALINTIRANGKVNPDTMIFGENALSDFVKDPEVKEALDNRRMDIGQLNPRMVASGATYYGNVFIGAYSLEMWAYPEGYTDPQTKAHMQYINTNNVVVISKNTRLDRCSARVPLPLGPDPRVASLIPGRLMDRANDLDVTPNLFCSPNGRQITAELLSRPLLVPVQIDGFGCLTTR